jgi:hypothetical protein
MRMHALDVMRDEELRLGSRLNGLPNRIAVNIAR